MAHIAIIGSGIAGLFAGLRCAEHGFEVSIITKSAPRDSSTNWAQGGIAGILDKTDLKGVESHIVDTLAAGAGHCDEDIVRSVCREAGDRIMDLLEIGVRFERDGAGSFDLAREGGHATSRILHSKDATGAEIERALMEAVDASDSIRMLSGHLAIDLILRDRDTDEKDVRGLWCLDDENRVVSIGADVVMIATGGAGQLYRQTTNPEVATADGVAMAHRAGASTRDMEFVQFHPTALALPEDRPFLISEAVRGHGGVLLTTSELDGWDGISNPDQLSFTYRYSDSGNLATRDLVARATDSELKRSGDPHVYLVCSHLGGGVGGRFPTIEERLSRHGLSLDRDPIPVSPAAHYMVGGLEVDSNGAVLQSSPRRVMEGLYAIGEVACTGMHGANRLASNSLLEAVVFAYRASEHLCSNIVSSAAVDVPSWRGGEMDDPGEHAPLVHDRVALQSTMTDDVGLVKSRKRLNRASRRIELLAEEVDRLWQECRPSRELVELRNMVEVSSLICAASIKRRENIGLHFNKDDQ